MGDRRLVAYGENIISKNETKMIKKVLNKYDFRAIDFSKVRSVYKIETTSGNKCLKRTKHGKYKIRNGHMLVEELKKAGFNNIADYYNTKQGAYYVKYNKWVFYATDWIDGEECDLSYIEEVEECAKLLGEFHKATKNIDLSKINVKNHLKKWPKVFSRNLNDMEKFKKVIQHKRVKNEFDSIYYEHIENFYSRGLVALNYLNTSDYYRISKETNKDKSLCHNSFYYQNIIKKDNKYYLIDLDSIIIDIQVNDLGKFIRRLMAKKEYQWDFEKAKRIIKAYNSVYKLEKSDLEVMLALIIFPHKFWKLGKKRYKKHKHWSEGKYMNKLNKIIKYDEYERKFLEEYIKYLEEY
ncbi:CotS family spore coat protein [Clostridium niameyense]|uniref:CotS family spore coat protein n=1 Tax=Clostridium niameyense TaxID=1622073 RepID=A0A6M0R7I4_9CLOT|nr:CotS family spore coat protein [Clostridium niameyense]NEZ46191.1 CotS family spore coat protein [Clostridium niameyense]